MASDPIRIEGDGIVACCCARLLHTQLSLRAKPRPAAILASQATQTLLADVFGRNDLFRDFPPVNRRIVCWGPGAETVELPHTAMVVNEQLLLDRLAAGLTMVPLAASGPRLQLHFGTRTASVVPVRLKAGVPTDACWVESVEDGWLFLMPGTLVSVGAGLNQSRLVRSQIDEVAGSPAEFAAYPRIVNQLTGSDWLVCGSAAMAFDPVCGEGAANAVREAILASAVVRAVERGYPAADLLAHYESRLLSGFLRHLETCRDFYTRGGSGPWWQRELALLNEGIASTRNRLRGCPPPRYRLVNFELQAINLIDAV